MTKKKGTALIVGRRRDHFELLIEEFERYFSNTPPKLSTDPHHWHPPLKILIAEKLHGPRSQHEEREIDEARQLYYPRGCNGVYLFVDTCCENDVEGNPPDDSEQFTVVRDIGSTTADFSNRLRNRKHKKDKKQFSYRWIEIIPFHEHPSFFAPALEIYLLFHLATTDNGKHKGHTNARIYKEW
jgi:hypothetical protein